MRDPRPVPRMPAAALVVANLVPVVGVVGFGWSLHDILLIYWLETGVIAVSYVARIRRAQGEDDPDELPGVSLYRTPVTYFVDKPRRHVVGAFLSNYGVLWCIYGLFVLSFVGLFRGVPQASLQVVGIGAVSLAAYHAISYHVNYVGRREYERLGPVTLMVEPYRRVFVLHATILAAAVGAGSLGSPVGVLVVMVLVKTVLDLRGHWSEHERARRRSRTRAAAK